MIRSLFRTPDERLHTDLPPGEFAAALQTPDGLLWVDLEGEPPEICEPIPRETSGFHPLAIDDALQETHVPKVDDWGEYLCVVLHAVNFEEEGQADLDTLELDAFLGQNYVVTYRSGPSRPWIVSGRPACSMNAVCKKARRPYSTNWQTSWWPTICPQSSALTRSSTRSRTRSLQRQAQTRCNRCSGSSGRCFT